MPANRAPEDLPVLFLYNIDNGWNDLEIMSAIDINKKMMSALANIGHDVISEEIKENNLKSLLSKYSPEKMIIFNQCENIPGTPFGEHDVAKIIESKGFAYTGSTPGVLQLAEDKVKVKQILNSLNLPTPEWKVYNKPAANDWNLFPAIVKTTFEHCSLGLDTESVVMNQAELEHRIEYIIENFNQPALVEDFIDGREFHVPLYGNGEIHILPVVEMDFSAFNDIHDRLCTYDSKFDPGSIHYRKIESHIPSILSADDHSKLEEICLNAYKAIGCRDYARIDVRERNGIFYILDINPNADLDIDASIACAAEFSGISYPEMLNYLVRLAASRHPLFSESSDVPLKRSIH